MESTKYDVIIVGSGPGAYVAGLYSATAKHKTLIIENKSKYSDNYQNYDKMAGIRDCESKCDFLNKIRDQTKKFNVDFIDLRVTNVVSKDKRIFLEISNVQYETLILIIDDLQFLESFFGDKCYLIDKKRGLSNIQNIFLCGSAANCIPEAVILCASGCIAALDSKEYLNSS